ncbi:MAG: FAD-binding protein, partial [Gaiellaceae bacterium]
MLNPNTTITTGTTPQASLIHPGHELYDVARASWNLAVEQRPACICLATEVEHVQSALGYAREHGLTVASQSTGHLSETLPSLENTLLLRLDLHRGAVEVDAAERVARIKAGASWGDVVEAVTPHGLAVMHGSSPSVGV